MKKSFFFIKYGVEKYLYSHLFIQYKNRSSSFTVYHLIWSKPLFKKPTLLKILSHFSRFVFDNQKNLVGQKRFGDAILGGNL